MGKFKSWIINFLMITILATSIDARGTRAIILYTYDDAMTGSEVLSMELNSSQFMEAVKTSKYISSTEAEPLKFDSGYFSLLEGKDTTFKLTRYGSEVKCQCKATPKPTTTTARPTTTTTRKITTPKPVVTTTATRRTTPPHTYLPPTTTKGVTTTTVDPCPNGGKGPFCCTNGAKNVDCCVNNGKGPFCCQNGADNADCCKNGGKGKYCCTNGATNPECALARTTTTTRKLRSDPTTTTTQKRTTTTRRTTTSKFRGPPYLPIDKRTTPPSAYSERTYTWGTFVNTWSSRWNYTVGTGTWIPYTRDYTIPSTTTTPRYQRKDGQDDNSLKYLI